MTITCSVTQDQTRVDISVMGRFNFTLRKEFREAYRNHLAHGEYRVNLAKTDFIDSSALGMLLLLREHAELSKSRVVLVDPKPGVRRALTIANFDRLFTIE